MAAAARQSIRIMIRQQQDIIALEAHTMLQNNGMKNIENFHLQPLITLLFPTRRRASEGDPSDPHTLNLAGFDTSTPEVVSMFARGEL